MKAIRDLLMGVVLGWVLAHVIWSPTLEWLGVTLFVLIACATVVTADRCRTIAQ